MAYVIVAAISFIAGAIIFYFVGKEYGIKLTAYITKIETIVADVKSIVK